MFNVIFLSFMWTVNSETIQIALNASDIVRNQQTVLNQVMEFLEEIQQKIRHSQDLIEIMKNNTKYNKIDITKDTTDIVEYIKSKEIVLNDRISINKGNNEISTEVRNKTMILQALRSIAVRKPQNIKDISSIKTRVAQTNVNEEVQVGHGVVPEAISDYDVEIPELMKTAVLSTQPTKPSPKTTIVPPIFFKPEELMKKEPSGSTTPGLDIPVPDPISDYVDIFAESQNTGKVRLLRQGLNIQTTKTETLNEFQQLFTLKDIPLPTQPTKFRSEIYDKMHTELVGYFSAGFWKLLLLIDSKPYGVVKEVFQWLPHMLYRIPFGQFRRSVVMQTIQNLVNAVRMFTFNQIRTYAKRFADLISNRKQRYQKDMNFIFNIFDILLTKEQGENIINVLSEFRDYPNHSTKKSNYQLCEAIVNNLIMPVLHTVNSKTDYELNRLSNQAMSNNLAPNNAYGNYNYRPTYKAPYRN